MVRKPMIVALGGGGWMMEPDNPLLDDYLLSLTGVNAPKLALLPTASGDSEGVISRFYQAFKGRARCSHLSLFRRDQAADMLLQQDIIFVSGGNTANMLAVWRVHGVDQLLHAAWRSGVILAAISAGGMCWFSCGLTDSFGPRLQPLHDGLGWLEGSFCPHYDGELTRRPIYSGLVAAGTLPPGMAADDGAALVYVDTKLHEVVTSRPSARAYQVDQSGHHTQLPARYLADP